MSEFVVATTKKLKKGDVIERGGKMFVVKSVTKRFSPADMPQEFKVVAVSVEEVES